MHAVGLWCLFGVLALPLAGCKGPQTRPPAVTAQPTADRAIAVEADWDDLWAAGMGGGSPYGWVVVTEAERTPTSVRFELLSVRDQPGWLLAERTTEAPEIELHPVTMTLSARLGRRGDPAAEAALLTAVADRLRELKGETVSTLPFREFAVPRGQQRPD